MKPIEPLDPSRLKTVRAGRRKSKVNTKDFARPAPPGCTFAEFYDSLPDILKGKELRELARAAAKAHRKKRGIVWALGGHVVKVGCAPLLVDLMERGLVTSLLLNGAAAIHDFEIAYMGKTSEDVGPGVLSGTFGMADETGSFFARAAEEGREIGLGEALKRRVLAEKLPNAHLSLLGSAARLDVPVTVHVAIGTDIVHMHPACDGASLGAATLLDFRRFAALCRRLDGGVFLNWGSAVLAPEVFVKAVTLQNNLRKRPLSITTANFDQLRHYRPRVNVVERPAKKGYDFSGHHEMLMPLYRLALLCELEREAPR